MKDRNCQELLAARWDAGLYLSVGLDPVLASTSDLDAHDIVARLYEPCRRIIYETANSAAAFKPNLAFFEGYGLPGLRALRLTLEYIRDTAPEVPVVLDYKRGDIGNTNLGSVRQAFEHFEVDGVTLNPYLGQEACAPFLVQKNKMLFFLCRTSNKGSDEFQGRRVWISDEEMRAWSNERLGHHIPFYQVVAYRISRHWNENNNCGLVVGATYPAEMAEVRRIVGNMPILAPGIGTQGGDLRATARGGMGPNMRGLLVNSSSGIMNAASPRAAAEEINATIADELSRR